MRAAVLAICFLGCSSPKGVAIEVHPGATSSDTSVVPSVTGSAVPSSYAIEVSQLARVQKSRSDAQASATTALGQAGSLGRIVNIS